MSVLLDEVPRRTKSYTDVFLRDLDAYDVQVPSKEEKEQLYQDIIADPENIELRNRLAESCLRLAITEVNRFIRSFPRVNQTEAYGIAFEALVRASRAFDPNYGNQFTTYAAASISRDLYKNLTRGADDVVYKPHRLRYLVAKLDRDIPDWRKAPDRFEEFAEKYETSLANVKLAAQTPPEREISLSELVFDRKSHDWHEPSSKSDHTRIDLGDEFFDVDKASKHLLGEAFRVVSKLSGRIEIAQYRAIMQWHYEGHSYSDIGKMVALSRERVHQIVYMMYAAVVYVICTKYPGVLQEVDLAGHLSSTQFRRQLRLLVNRLSDRLNAREDAQLVRARLAPFLGKEAE